MAGTFLHIQIDKDAKVPLFRQIYEKIRDDILLSNLVPGTCLPATRRLAKELNISRNVVLDAYDQLQAEGYIESTTGSYTRVADDTYYKNYCRQEESIKKVPPAMGSHDIEFQSGVPDLRLFPRALWGRYLKQAVQEASIDDLSYHRPEGLYSLRETLADYLYRARGIRVSPDNIVVTSGATQALFLSARILFSRGCNAVLEDPCGYGVIQILQTAGFELNPIPSGSQGFNCMGTTINPHTRLVYVTPSHQFPMGHIMPAVDRISLLETLENQDIYIVEDDYDSEFRYDGPPIHPLKALNPEKVIYLGSLSKVLNPALRMGYAILPGRLLKRFKQYKRFSDAQSPLIDQIALKNFILDGTFEKHIFKMKNSYKKKRDTLIHALKDSFGSSVTIFGENAGLHMVAQFNNLSLDMNHRFSLCHNGVLLQSVEKHALVKGNHKNMVVFGYGNLSQDEIIKGIKMLNRFT